jgi:hypothetical protein
MIGLALVTVVAAAVVVVVRVLMHPARQGCVVRVQLVP